MTSIRLIVIFILLSVFSLLYAAEQCPYNIENDPFPGKCWRYIDENNDSICDLSQDIESTENTIYESNEIITKDTFAGRSDSVIEIKKIMFSEHTDSSNNSQNNEILVINEIEEELKTIPLTDKYALKIIIPIWFLFLIITVISKSGRLKGLKYINQIWNWIILVSFIPVSATSIIFILADINILQPRFIGRAVFLHNITGIIFILGAIGHLYIKWTYYKNCLKKKKCEEQ